jgi:hypothetical protein
LRAIHQQVAPHADHILVPHRRCRPTGD